jgi:DNA replication licensing factor MCM5
MIFIVRDEHNETRDKVSFFHFTDVDWPFLQTIAKHVLNIHMNRPNVNNDEDGNAVGEIDLDNMKAYIAYCRRYFELQIF